jgi:hypothetical protein
VAKRGGFLSALFGRTEPAKPDLDALFALPSAAVTLKASLGLEHTSKATVGYKPASGQAFAATDTELTELLGFSGEQSGTSVHSTDDRYGYRWVVLDDPDLEDLVGAAHVVNNTLESRGFGPQLLCSVFGFSGPRGACHLVYLYKRGTYYPFAPRSGERRDNEIELQVRGAVSGDLPIEEDLSRWFPLWGIPL